MCGQVCVWHLFHICASSIDVLAHFRDNFLEDMDAKAIVYELHHHGFIRESDMMSIIRSSSKFDQNCILYEVLKHECDEDAFTEVCNLMCRKRLHRMESLANKMRMMLERKYCLHVHACVRYM